MTDRLGQSAVQSTTSGGIRETGPVVSSDAVKYNPGWGLVDQAPYASIDTSLRPTQINLINTLGGTNATQFMLAFYWGGLQTGDSSLGEAAYKFDLIDAALALCQQNGLRLHIIVQWSVQSSGSVDFQISSGRFPAYLRDNTAKFGAGGCLFQSPTPGRCTAAVFRPEVMAEYALLMQAISDRYNNHPWFEGVHTYDSAQQMSNIPGYSVGAYRDRLIDLCEEMPDIWPNTGWFMSLDSGLAGAANMQQCVQAVSDNRGILTHIDLFPIGFTAFGTDDVNGTLGQRVYQGIDGTKDFRGELGWGGRISPNNLGDIRLPSAAQMNPTTILTTLIHTNIVTNIFHGHYCFMPWKTVGFGTSATALANNQFWDVAAAGYTLYHPTIKEFLSQSPGAIALNTNVPANYGSVITGGT